MFSDTALHLYAEAQPVRSRMNIGGSFPSMYNVDFLVHPATRTAWGHKLTEILYLWTAGEVYIVTVTGSDWNLLAEESFLRVKADPQLVTSWHARSLEAGRELKRFCERELDVRAATRPSGPALAETYHQLVRRFRDFCSKNVVLWFLTGDRLHAELRRIVARRTPDGGQILEELTTSPHPSFLSEERIAFFTLAAETWKDATSWRVLQMPEADAVLPQTLRRQLAALSRRFSWVPFEYVGPTQYDESHYLDELRRLARSDQDPEAELRALEHAPERRRALQDQRRRELALTDDEWRLFQDYHTISDMSLEKKAYCIQAQVPLQTNFLPIVSRYTKIPLTALRFMTEDEITAALNGGEQPPDVLEREESSAFIASEGHLAIFTGKAASRYHEVFARQSTETDELMGDVACLGRASGPAKIVKRPAELSKVYEGDILVATMTTPDFTAAMRRAAAVVTDEGGIMSHAAIVSRELGLPCIIGTQRATRVFLDEQLLEVDAQDEEQGYVRKLNNDGA